MDSIFITGDVARTIRRLSRRGIGISLEPSELNEILPLGRSHVTLKSLALDEVCSSVGLKANQQLELRVPEAGARLRAKGIKSRVCSVSLPAGSFERIVPATNGSALHLPEDLDVFVDSPSLSFIDAAQRLTHAVGAGAISLIEAELRLLKLGVEDCSSYSLDPWAPRERDCSYGLVPTLSRSDLCTYVAAASGMNGLGLARRVAPLVFDGSGSEMETFINGGLSLPPMQGGLKYPSPLANHRIPLSDLQKLMLNHVDHITPDLLWEAWRIIIEYLGKAPHQGQAAQNEDTGRIQDYQVLGYLVFPLTYVHVKDPIRFNAFARRLASTMDTCGAHGMREWVDTLLEDKGFLARQRQLFSILLPPVRDRV